VTLTSSFCDTLIEVSGVLVNVLNYELGKRRHSGVVPYRCLSGKGAGMNPELT